MSTIAQDVRTAAVTGISAITFDSPLPAGSIVGRKTPALPSGKNPPAIVVSVDPKPEVEDIYAGFVMVTYIVTIAMYVTTLGASNDDTVMDEWRQKIGRKLHDRAAFNSVAGANETTRRDMEPFEQAALEALYNAGVMQIELEVLEPRN